MTAGVGPAISLNGGTDAHLDADHQPGDAAARLRLLHPRRPGDLLRPLRKGRLLRLRLGGARIRLSGTDALRLPVTTVGVLPDAWTEVRARLLRFVERRVRSRADAEDIVQAVFAQAAAHRADLRHGDRLVPWLFRITRNAIADYYRAGGRDPLAGAVPETGVRGEPLEELPADEPESDDRASAALARCMTPMLESLAPAYRDALRQVELENRRQVDVARELGIPISTLKSRVQRGRVMLRAAFVECCAIAQSSTGGISSFEPHAGACDPSCG